MITINLTTTSARLDLCRIALTSLLMQSYLPDQINLWVSRSPFLADAGFSNTETLGFLLDSLPAEHRARVVVHWVENIGPYRKLIPALRAAQEGDLVVTADDDIFYGQHWLRYLLEAHWAKVQAGQRQVVASRVRQVTLNPLKRSASYIHWPLVAEARILPDAYVVTFGGGAVLERHFFAEEDLAKNSFLELAPTADDLWYSKLLQRQGLGVQIVPEALSELYFIQHQQGLQELNLPRRRSLWQRLRLRLWTGCAGYLGLPVCGNDVAAARIARYFDSSC